MIYATQYLQEGAPLVKLTINDYLSLLILYFL